MDPHPGGAGVICGTAGSLGVHLGVRAVAHVFVWQAAYTRMDRQALTALLAVSGTGQRPLRLHCWSKRLQQYNNNLRFTPGRENVVDLLSWATPWSLPDTGPDVAEMALILMLHSSIKSMVLLQDLQLASEQDLVLS